MGKGVILQMSDTSATWLVAEFGWERNATCCFASSRGCTDKNKSQSNKASIDSYRITSNIPNQIVYT